MRYFIFLFYSFFYLIKIIKKSIKKMKQFLLSSMLCITFFNGSITAQITINRADFAISGTALDSSRYKLLTKTGAVLPTLGSNQTWDYSALKDSIPSIFKDTYTPATSFGTPPAVFSDATLAANTALSFQGFSYPAREFYKLDATGYQDLGYATNGGRFSIVAVTGSAADSLNFIAQNMRYSTPHTIYKFPMTANTVARATYKDTSNFQLSVAAFGLSKTPGARVAQFSFIDTIVGWGTLKMRNPSGGTALSYAVLMQRETFSEIDSFFLGGAPAPATLLSAFGLVQGAVLNYLPFYRFIGVGFNEPFMSIYTNTTGGVSNAYRAVLPTLGLTVDTKGTADYLVATKVYPNPTTEGVNFEFQKTNAADWHIMVYNSVGQIITIQRVSAVQGNVNQRVTFDSALPSGTYFYNLLDETSLIRANGKVALNR